MNKQNNIKTNGVEIANIETEKKENYKELHIKDFYIKIWQHEKYKNFSISKEYIDRKTNTNKFTNYFDLNDIPFIVSILIKVYFEEMK